MDPLSMVAGIGGICGVTAGIISALSEFVDNVDSAPAEVQALSNELATLYSNFGQMRIALEVPRLNPLPAKCIADFDAFLKDCSHTLNWLRNTVAMAKNIESSRKSATELWKIVKFTFDQEHIRILRARISSQNGVIENILLALAETRGGHIQRRLEDIHDMVASLLASREHVEKSLVVSTAKDDLEQDVAADHTLGRGYEKQSQSSASNLARTMQTPYRPAPRRTAADHHQDTKERSSNESTWDQRSVSDLDGITIADDEVEPNEILPTAQNKTQLSTDGVFQIFRSEKEENAFKRAKSTSWPIAMLTQRGPGEASKLSLGLGYKIKISGDQFLRIVISKSDNNPSNHVWQRYYALKKKSTATGSTHASERVTMAETNDQFDIKFLTDLATTEFYDCLEGLQCLYRRTWEQQAIIQNLLLGDSPIDTPDQLEFATVNEYRALLASRIAVELQTTPAQTQTTKSTPTRITPSTVPAAIHPLAQEFVQAAKEGHIAKVTASLKSLVPIDCKHNGWTALGIAANHGQLGVVRVLVDRGASINTVMDDKTFITPLGGTALNWAAKGGYIRIVKLLVERGADLNVESKKDFFFGSGGIPIMLAATGDHLEVVKFLLTAAADLERNSQGWEVFTLACQKGCLSVVGYFVKELKYDVRRKTSDENGYTALHLATLGQHTAIMRLLVDAGANVGDKDNNGDTPLDLAELKSLSRAENWLRTQGTSGQTSGSPFFNFYEPV